MGQGVLQCAPWVGAGFGYQFTPDIALELRYAAMAYEAERGQPFLQSFSHQLALDRHRMPDIEGHREDIL